MQARESQSSANEDQKQEEEEQGSHGAMMTTARKPGPGAIRTAVGPGRPCILAA